MVVKGEYTTSPKYMLDLFCSQPDFQNASDFQRYKADGHHTIVLAGEEYGSGSSRDWAAKGPMLLVYANHTTAISLLATGN